MKKTIEIPLVSIKKNIFADKFIFIYTK